MKISLKPKLNIYINPSSAKQKFSPFADIIKWLVINISINEAAVFIFLVNSSSAFAIVKVPVNFCDQFEGYRSTFRINQNRKTIEHKKRKPLSTKSFLYFKFVESIGVEPTTSPMHRGAQKSNA
ncbi:MAG: hypothetical protein WCI53_12750 [Bacteroidota bacterium]